MDTLTNELVALGAPITLRDGSRVRVRQIHSSDKELLLRGFDRLSRESRYRRFLAPIPQLSEAVVRYLTEVDHHDHEAIVALDEEGGEGIGAGTLRARRRHAPTWHEVAVTVIDDWQGRGPGHAAAGGRQRRAREEDISRFTALMLATNQEMMSRS